MLERVFRLRESGTDVRTELVAGTTTFMTMCYILVVNPQLLAQTGMPFDGVLFATCVCSAGATLIMGLAARYPIALAPGMGLNAYFALVVAPQLTAITGSQEAGWRAALGAVFLSGMLFLLLSLVRAREKIITGVPAALKLAISAGIGLFIALIGFQHGGIVRAHPATLLTLGDMHSPDPWLTIGGILLVTALTARGIKGAVLYSIIVITVVSIASGHSPVPTDFIAAPHPLGTLFRLDVPGAVRAGIINIIFAFFFVDLFDTLGTLIGVAEQGGFLDANGALPRAPHALFADAMGTVLGSLFGTSTITSYIESAAGVAAGGKTGLTAVVTALLFLSALLFSPLFRAVPPFATAPALIIVGALMAGNVRKIAWDDVTESMPAFITLIGIAFTFSIADGMALGFISYAAIKGLVGRWREVGLITWLLAAAFLLRYLLL